MRILLYEFITGGGWHLIDPARPPDGSLLAEGTAMRDALAHDLAAIAGVEVMLFQDPRLPPPRLPPPSAADDCYQMQPVASAEQHLPTLLAAATQCDATLLIAPEFDGHLAALARAVEDLGAPLLSPSAPFVELTTDKHRTSLHLAAAGIRVPRGHLLAATDLSADIAPPLPYPAVLKPNDGAGSLNVRHLNSPADVPSPEQLAGSAWRWEELAPGTPASVALLCGATPLPCPACYQRLSDDGSFSYQGGRRIEDQSLAERAQQLALRAMAALPPTVGYVGIDLILGGAADGSEDVVIEVNPRLTTSYVGLRQLARQNLAAAMLDNARGIPAELSWREGTIQFEADGTCHG